MGENFVVDGGDLVEVGLKMDWPFSAVSRFAVWMSLNLVFLWGGMLVYCVSLTRLLKVAYRQKLRRALLMAPSIFLPIYVATLILMNLFACPGQCARRAFPRAVACRFDAAEHAHPVPGQQRDPDQPGGVLFREDRTGVGDASFCNSATEAMRKFDEITVMLLPDVEHFMVGPKIAIEQFELQPR
jgi:hypothetical protein